MSSDVTIVERVVEGVVDPARAMAVCSDAAVELRSSGRRKVLIDVSAVPRSQLRTNGSMTVSLYSVHSTMAEIFPQGTRVAILVPPNGRVREEMAFGENVSLNRGLSVRYFSDRGAAVDWLEGR